MTLGIVAALVAAYMLTGWRIALRQLPTIWKQARDRWGPEFPDDIRIEVRAEMIGTILFWPLALMGRGILSTFDAVLNRAEVREFRRQLNNHD